MVKKLSMLFLVFCLIIVFSSSASFGGTEPSPWKQAIERIIQRLQPLTPEESDISPDIKSNARAIIGTLSSIYSLPKADTTDFLLVKTVGAINRITAVLFDPQPEPPAHQLDILQSALSAIENLLTIGLYTPPQLRSLATKTVGMLDRITAVLFDPQPEPPALGALPAIQKSLNIVIGMSNLVLLTDPDIRLGTRRVVSALNGILAVLFDPQPEPPAKFALDYMFGILNEISGLNEMEALPTPGRIR